jgi:hypothetical protein
MGFHPAWKYEEVYELAFESGKLKSENDPSSIMAEARHIIEIEIADKGEVSTRKEIEACIDECFRRNYKR